MCWVSATSVWNGPIAIKFLFMRPRPHTLVKPQNTKFNHTRHTHFETKHGQQQGQWIAVAGHPKYSINYKGRCMFYGILIFYRASAASAESWPCPPATSWPYCPTATCWPWCPSATSWPCPTRSLLHVPCCGSKEASGGNLLTWYEYSGMFSIIIFLCRCRWTSIRRIKNALSRDTLTPVQ